MPLVRIDIIENRRTPDEVKKLADIVQDVMRETFDAPARDRYQIITEHKPGNLIAEDTGLGYTRTDDLVMIQITQQGRDEDNKKALYSTLAERLKEQTGLSGDDLIIAVSENTPADWSFGHGVAQFLEGQL
ncbi:tautomerase family protein [Rhodococcus sp. MALMAid1271]|uniref:tautomerase family protein n=1 Tax=Rhodococcus sp. MALMAid1271 TaxID=3411744 RepID=UPI003BA0D4C5